MDVWDADMECDNTYFGYLAQISTEDENNFVKDLLRKDATDEETSAWIGMEQHFNSPWYKLFQDEEVTYTDWATPTGSQNTSPKCAVFSKDVDWAWKEKGCTEEVTSRAFVCERDTTQVECFGGSCYDLFNPRVGIRNARDMCGDIGGYLVEIDTEEERDFVKNFLSRAQVPESMYDSNKNVWLGASDEDTEGEFYWKNGNTAVKEFSDWAVGEPDNNGPSILDEDCAELDSNNDWKWNDIMCLGSSKAVLCERPNVSPISG